MPRIQNIEDDATLSNNDKLLGSDSTGATRNFPLPALAEFLVTGTSAFKHHQNNASATWTITHNLDLEHYLPHVNIKLSGGATYNNVQAMGIVTYITKDKLKIEFLDNRSGYAYIKK